MKRAERTEYTSIKRNLADFAKRSGLGHGTTLTIRTNAGTEYKKALHDLYTGYGFHPANIRIDRQFFDENERIIYIYGLTWKDNDGNDRSWTELYTRNEKDAFEAALN